MTDVVHEASLMSLRSSGLPRAVLKISLLEDVHLVLETLDLLEHQDQDFFYSVYVPKNVFYKKKNKTHIIYSVKKKVSQTCIKEISETILVRF